MDHVVATLGLDVIVAAQIRDDVVAFTTVDDVVAESALEPIIAAIAEQCVVANARDQRIGSLRTAKNDVLVASITQIVSVDFRSSRVVADHQLGENSRSHRIGAFKNSISIKVVELPRLVHLEDEAWS